MKTWIPVVGFGAVFLATTLACGSGEEVAEDGSLRIPNSNPAMRAMVPEGATPNGIGGAAGFHTDDDSFSMTVREATTQGQSKAEHKTQIESFAFNEWISESDLEDGYAFAYVTEMGGVKGNQVSVVRKIDGTDFVCTGASSSKEGTAAVIDACKSVRK
ncbi:MAG: hypothetical protein AB8H79_02425 [Myxococcota bacterium]